MKFGKSSLVRPPAVRRRLAIVFLAGTLRRRRCFAARCGFFLKRFFEPRGKNLPLASLGSDLASFLPLATLLDDFLRLRLALGISSLICSY